MRIGLESNKQDLLGTVTIYLLLLKCKFLSYLLKGLALGAKVNSEFWS